MYEFFKQFICFDDNKHKHLIPKLEGAKDVQEAIKILENKITISKKLYDKINLSSKRYKK